MTIIPYTRTLTIRNIESLPHGTGCRYLEVINGLHGEYVAVAWRRTPPRDLPRTRKLIEFLSVAICRIPPAN